MCPSAIYIIVTVLCFGYVSAVAQDYSTQPGETVLYLNNENNASLSDMYNITNREVSFTRPLEEEEEREDNRPTDVVREEEELNWEQFKCIFPKDADITMVYSASNGTYTKGDESKNGSYCLISHCYFRINDTILKGVCAYVFTVNATEISMSRVKKEEIRIGLTPGTYIQFRLFVKTNNSEYYDEITINNEEFNGTRPSDEHEDVDGERKAIRPAYDAIEEEELNNWKQFKCIFRKDVDITVVYSASNGTFTKGDESKNSSYCSILPCYYPINGTVSTGFCVSVFTVNTTEFAMSGVKNEEIIFGITPGTYVQFNLFVKNNNYDYYDDDDDDNEYEINNEDLGDIGPLHEDEEVDGDRNWFRLIKVLGEDVWLESEEQYCEQNTENIVNIVYNALDGTFTEKQPMNGTTHILLRGFYRVNTNLTIPTCVYLYSISTQELANKFLELPKMLEIPFHRTFIVGLTRRVFIKANLYVKQNMFNFSPFVNFTYHDFIRALDFRKFMHTFHYQILYVTSTISIVGNILICSVIIKYKNMRNSPNIYAFNLALADIMTFSMTLVLDLVPEESLKSRLNQWIWFSTIGLYLTGRNVNIWTTVGITVDRYIAICHPFLARTVSTQSKAVKINIAIWIISMLHALVYVLYIRLYIIGYNSPVMDIVEVIFHNRTTFLILFVLLPMFIIIVLYVFIVRSIWKSSKLKGSSNTRGQSMAGKSLKLSVAIVVQFFICYVPISTIKHLKSFLESIGVNKFYIKLLGNGIQIVKLSSATMDVVLYSLISKRFRDAFKDMLCPSWIRHKWF